MKKYFFACAIAIILALAPFLINFFYTGFFSRVPFEAADDSLYYYARSNDIDRGNIFIGNPYILEHKDDISVLFFVSDWLWSIPLALGFSISQAVIVNQLLWFLISALLIIWLLSILDIQDKYQVCGVAIILITLYWDFARPVSMQIVFPFFLLFLIYFISFITDPLNNKKALSLGIVAGISLYMYTYLALIMALTFISTFILSFIPLARDTRKGVIIAGVTALICSLPFIQYFLIQLSNPYNTQTMTRLGLLHTHSIGGLALIYSFALVCIGVGTLLIKDTIPKHYFISVSIVNTVLLVSLVSNLVTGIDLELSPHMARFIDLWFVILIIFGISNLSFLKNNKHLSKLFFIPLLAIVIYGVAGDVHIWNAVKKTNQGEQYLFVIDYFNSHHISNKVILANNHLSQYIPLMTSNYVVFNQYAGFHFVSDNELENRYLTSHIFEETSDIKLKADFRQYAGVGNAVHQANLVNRNIKECLVLKVIYDELRCKAMVTPVSLRGQAYFDELYMRDRVIKFKQNKFLKLYSVSYVVEDLKNDNWNIKKNLGKVVASNNRFRIIELYTQ